MNNDKLREVARAIELEPEAFEMQTWLEPSSKTLCGSVGCVAGTTVLTDQDWQDQHPIITEGEEMWYDHYDDGDVADVAAALLDMEPRWYGDHSHPLFTSGTWWYRACKRLGLPLPNRHEIQIDERTYAINDMDGYISWVTAKHAATVLYALADGTITIEQFCDV